MVSPNRDPNPLEFTPERIDLIARSWVEFNQGYQHAANAKFDKYALRLNEPVVPERAKSPRFVLAPYTMTSGTDDPWWNVSRMLYERTCHHMGESEKCIRVVAATSATGLSHLLRELPDSRALVWVSDLDELDSSPAVLKILRQRHSGGTRRFATVRFVWRVFQRIAICGRALRFMSWDWIR